jgi:hypothetical protein
LYNASPGVEPADTGDWSSTESFTKEQHTRRRVAHRIVNGLEIAGGAPLRTGLVHLLDTLPMRDRIFFTYFFKASAHSSQPSQ